MDKIRTPVKYVEEEGYVTLNPKTNNSLVTGTVTKE